MKRPLVRAVLLAAFFAIASTSSPAWAHEEINPASFPIGQPVYFLLSAANETKADLTRITLGAPPNLAFGATTRAPAGWTASRGDKVITYSGPGIKPDTWEQWGFEIDGADQPGTYTYKVTLGFADARTEDVSVPVRAVAATGATGTATAPPSPGATGVGTGLYPTSAVPLRLSPANVRSVDAARSRGTLGLVLGAAGAGLGLLALMVAVTRRPRGNGPAVGAAQDW
ncbi:MAG: hypothetical protein ACYDAD_07715 [Acidimicrobiales bacterium]